MANKVAIGILAYNEELHIETVVQEISTLGVNFYIINDSSTDKTSNILNNLKKNIDFKIIENNKNEGAGASTIKLLEKIKEDGFEYAVKVDGDNQFKLVDVEKIINLLNSEKYDFIKSNRFWEKGIEGKIPNKRYLGNLFATMILQFISGTNKLFDPLNGLFGINVKVLEMIDKRAYPKRYGYPFYFSALSAISFFNIFQINNTVSYGDQKSNLSSVKMIFTLTKLTFHFMKLKIRNKILIGKYQRSAFLDILFLLFLFISSVTLIRFILIFTSIQIFNSSFVGSWFLILLLILFFTIFVFIESFKEEKSIRNEFINNED